MMWVKILLSVSGLMVVLGDSFKMILEILRVRVKL